MYPGNGKKLSSPQMNSTAFGNVRWSGWSGSNRRGQLGRLEFYHWTTPAYGVRRTQFCGRTGSLQCQRLLLKVLWLQDSFADWGYYTTVLNKLQGGIFRSCFVRKYPIKTEVIRKLRVKNGSKYSTHKAQSPQGFLANRQPLIYWETVCLCAAINLRCGSHLS